MNREIKYRAWVNGFLPEQSGMFYEGLSLLRSLPSGGFDRITASRNGVSYKFKSEEEPFILMQYTGLKDKNGQKIYEGDIVRTPGFRHGSPERVFAIEWNNIADHTSFGAGSHNMEVIGNIYENPELLKQD